MTSSHLFCVSVYVWLSAAVSATPPDGVSGLKSCYNDGEDVSIVISQTQSDTVSLTLTFNEVGNNRITYSNDDPDYTLMTPGYYNVTLLSVSPIQVNVSVIFKAAALKIEYRAVPIIEPKSTSPLHS